MEMLRILSCSIQTGSCYAPTSSTAESEHQVFGAHGLRLSHCKQDTQSHLSHSVLQLKQGGREGRKEGEKAGRHPDLRPWFSRISYGDHALLCHNVNTKARFQGLGRALWLLDICFLLSPFPQLGG